MYPFLCGVYIVDPFIYPLLCKLSNVYTGLSLLHNQGEEPGWSVLKGEKDFHLLTSLRNVVLFCFLALTLFGLRWLFLSCSLKLNCSSKLWS